MELVGSGLWKLRVTEKEAARRHARDAILLEWCISLRSVSPWCTDVWETPEILWRDVRLKREIV